MDISSIITVGLYIISIAIFLFGVWLFATASCKVFNQEVTFGNRIFHFTWLLAAGISIGLFVTVFF